MIKAVLRPRSSRCLVIIHNGAIECNLGEWLVSDARGRKRRGKAVQAGEKKKKKRRTQLNVMSCCKRWPPRSRRSIILYKDEMSSILLVEDTIDWWDCLDTERSTHSLLERAGVQYRSGPGKGHSCASSAWWQDLKQETTCLKKKITMGRENESVSWCCGCSSVECYKPPAAQFVIRTIRPDVFFKILNVCWYTCPLVVPEREYC